MLSGGPQRPQIFNDLLLPVVLRSTLPCITRGTGFTACVYVCVRVVSEHGGRDAQRQLEYVEFHSTTTTTILLPGTLAAVTWLVSTCCRPVRLNATFHTRPYCTTNERTKSTNMLIQGGPK